MFSKHRSKYSLDHLTALIAKLRRVVHEKNLHKRLVDCDKSQSDAQLLLDSFQKLLDIAELDTSFRKKLIVATQRLSTRFGIFPACYELKDIVQDSEDPVTQGGFADIFKDRREQVMKQIFKEAIIWSQLSHPNILAIYGIYRSRGRISIVSPWMENGNIRTYLQNKPATLRLPLALDVASGLSYLHEDGIIHGDLKGLNVLIDDAGRARLADFGLSGIADSKIPAWTSQSSGASRGGTVAWKAPELFDPHSVENAKNTKESDVYAWGCVAYEIFTGDIPPDNVLLAPRRTARPGPIGG
ncbi:hypothetical protein H0H92_009900 [Tricholoma furcatifolium]|nr:hypothetical protein H0H92_009900 [Tricholoma furcatifolium]